MGCTLVQKLLKICSWLWCWKKKTLKEHKSQKTSFYEFLFIWKLIKHIPIWNRYPKRLLMKPKVILLKPSWINHWNFVVVEILHTSHLEITITTYDTLRWIRTSLHSEVVFLCKWKHLSTQKIWSAVGGPFPWRQTDLLPFELKHLLCFTLGKALLLWASLNELGYDPQIRGGPGE
jgi:hypothetical protein